jgi:RNA polymerase sigma-70 factor (ECF subfamily)
MDRYLADVHRLLVSLNGTPDEAEDAAQECFISAWRGAATYDGFGSARGWLFAIARNSLRRQHRRHVGEPDTMVSLERLGEDAGWGAVSDFSARFDARDMLEHALTRLPLEEREVVALRDLAGFSGDDTAQALGLSVPAMKSRLHRGRLRLMGVLRALRVEDA